MPKLTDDAPDFAPEARQIVATWLHDHAPVGVKMMLDPSRCQPLIASIATHMAAVYERGRADAGSQPKTKDPTP